MAKSDKRPTLADIKKKVVRLKKDSIIILPHEYKIKQLGDLPFDFIETANDNVILGLSTAMTICVGDNCKTLAEIVKNAD